jgi:hypothetical protein
MMKENILELDNSLSINSKTLDASQLSTSGNEKASAKFNNYLRDEIGSSSVINN